MIPKELEHARNINVIVFSPRSASNSRAGGAEKYLHEVITRIVKAKFLVVSSSEREGDHKATSYSEYIVSKNELFFPMNLIKCVRLAKHFDLITENVSKFPTIWPLILSKLYSKPFVIIVHHIHGKMLFRELPLPIALLLYIYEILSLKIYALFATLVITVSESSRKELIKLGFPQDRIKVVPPGHFSKRETIFLDISKASYPLVVYVGRVKRYKRIGDLIKAISIVKKVVPNVKCVIAGNGDSKVYEELKELTRSLGLNSNVEFRGPISEEEKIRYLKKAWVYVMTSVKEGFSIGALEAQACGTPVVGYEIPGLVDSVKNGETGFLVPDGDYVALAEAMIRILLNEELRLEMARKAMLSASNYSWELSAEKFSMHITGVLSEVS